MQRIGTIEQGGVPDRPGRWRWEVPSSGIARLIDRTSSRVVDEQAVPGLEGVDGRDASHDEWLFALEGDELTVLRATEAGIEQGSSLARVIQEHVRAPILDCTGLGPDRVVAVNRSGTLAVVDWPSSELVATVEVGTLEELGPTDQFVAWEAVIWGDIGGLVAVGFDAFFGGPEPRDRTWMGAFDPETLQIAGHVAMPQSFELHALWPWGPRAFEDVFGTPWRFVDHPWPPGRDVDASDETGPAAVAWDWVLSRPPEPARSCPEAFDRALAFGLDWQRPVHRALASYAPDVPEILAILGVTPR